MPILLYLLYLTAHLLANCSLLSTPYFTQNFASKFGQGLATKCWHSFLHSEVCNCKKHPP